MFGNLGAFVNGNMFAGLFGSTVGVRLIDDASREELAAIEGTGPYGPAERPMGGYLALPQSWSTQPKLAASWVRTAMTRSPSCRRRRPSVPNRRPSRPSLNGDIRPVRRNYCVPGRKLHRNHRRRVGDNPAVSAYQLADWANFAVASAGAARGLEQRGQNPRTRSITIRTGTDTRR